MENSNRERWRVIRFSGVYQHQRAPWVRTTGVRFPEERVSPRPDKRDSHNEFPVVCGRLDHFESVAVLGFPTFATFLNDLSRSTLGMNDYR